MITITDGVTTLDIHQGVTWPDRFSAPGAAGSEGLTLGLRPIINRLPGAGAKVMTLQAELNGKKLSGYFLWSQYKQMAQWRDEGTKIEINYNDEIFKGFIPLTGLSLQLVFKKVNPQEYAKCYGTVKIQGAG